MTYLCVCFRSCHTVWVWDIYQTTEASRTLVLLDKGATVGSASMIPDSTAPPKQKSMELNQQAKGLTLDTLRAPAQKAQKDMYQYGRYGFMYEHIRHFHMV